MTLAHPLALVWGLIALPVVLLYLRKARLRRESVTTGTIWDQVFAEERARARWQRWRLKASVALQLVMVALVVLAMADPQIPRPQRLVLIVDNAAHMDATDVQPSRLAVAKEVAARLIAGLHGYDQMALLSAAAGPAVRCTWTSDQAALREAVESIGGMDAPSRMTTAVALARRMTAADAAARIVILSDACCADAVELAGQPGVQWLRVGTAAPNAAITQVAARRTVADPRVCEVLAEVRNFSDQPLAGRLLTVLDGKPLQTVPLHVAANGRWQRVFQVTTATAGRWSARLEPTDVLPADNEVALQLPGTARSVVVAPGEHDLRVPGQVGIDATGVVIGRPWPPLWMFLVAAATLLCAAEWCLYQRRWTS